MESLAKATKTIKGKTHCLFTLANFKKAYPEYENICNWRDGVEGQWVYTDDEHIVQILKKGSITGKGQTKTYIRTICGTFVIESNMIMDGIIAENIYTFSQSNEYKRFLKKKDASSKEVIFARYIALGQTSNGPTPTEAYMKTYDTTNKTYATNRAAQLLKTERVSSMIREEVRKILDEEGVSDGYIIRQMKSVADLSENDGTRMRSLEALAKISGLFEQEQKGHQELTVWQGFSPEQLKEVGEPALLAHAENDGKES
tara:strand:- start:1058 stop:1831 length:774 start_codon:yes stop_codon:yes gene_type:complete